MYTNVYVYFPGGELDREIRIRVWRGNSGLRYGAGFPGTSIVELEDDLQGQGKLEVEAVPVVFSLIIMYAEVHKGLMDKAHYYVDISYTVDKRCGNPRETLGDSIRSTYHKKDYSRGGAQGGTLLINSVF